MVFKTWCFDDRRKHPPRQTVTDRKARGSRELRRASNKLPDGYGTHRGKRRQIRQSAPCLSIVRALKRCAHRAPMKPPLHRCRERESTRRARLCRQDRPVIAHAAHRRSHKIIVLESCRRGRSANRARSQTALQAHDGAASRRFRRK